MSFSRLSFALLLLAAACGDLPRPYQGHPGATAQRLAQPPPARVAVPPSYSTYLPNAASKPYSHALATALQDQALPAVADYTRSGDWRIDLGVINRGETTIPTFTVVDPNGDRKGTEEGKPVPTSIWRKGDITTLKAAAADGAPRILALMERVEAARRQSDPNSLYNRSARVAVSPIAGAPGDGDITLTRLIREKLAKLGTVVQETTTGADFTLSAKVDYAPLTPKTHKVEITWLLHNTSNIEVGKIVQLNEVPNGLLDKYWGDVAVAATDEAAGAIRDVIMTQSGRRRSASAQPAAAQPQGQPPAKAQDQDELPTIYPQSSQQPLGQQPQGQQAQPPQAAGPAPAAAGKSPQQPKPARAARAQTPAQGTAAPNAQPTPRAATRPAARQPAAPAQLPVAQ